MIERTFQHIPGVGPWRERDLWARGIVTWDDFPPPGVVAMSPVLDEGARQRIADAREALAAKDLDRLARMIPPREHWRLYPAFQDEAAFFDIECDGADGALKPTVASVFDASGIRVFIAGRNLDELPAALAERRLWVTFNGSAFDVPVLQRCFPDLRQAVAHVDLRHLCRRVRLFGGLKEIEDQVGLSRPLHLRGVNGFEAVLLWRAYRAGDAQALRVLVEYNLYDAVDLRALLDIAYNRAVENLAFDGPRLRVFERGDVLYDVSKQVLSL